MGNGSSSAAQDAYRFYHIGDWQSGPTITPHARFLVSRRLPFSADQRVLAVVEDSVRVRLVDGKTLQTLITLDGPQDRLVVDLAAES